MSYVSPSEKCVYKIVRATPPAAAPQKHLNMHMLGISESSSVTN